MTKQEIQVIKVPLSPYSKNIDNQRSFPNLPRLYLELIENKSKIKQDLIDKDHSPVIINKSNNEKKKEDTFENKIQNLFDNDSDNENSSVKDKYIDKNNSKYDKYNDNNDDDINLHEQLSKYDDNEIKDDNNQNDNNNQNDDNNSEISDLSVRLNNLLSDNEDNDDRHTHTPDSVASSKYSRHRSKSSNETPANKNPLPLPPSLKELEKRGGIKIDKEFRQIDRISYNEQEEEDLKRELMFKIELLKKSYPNSIIPEFSIYTDYNTMKKSYDGLVRKLSLDSTVETYKTYLTGAFMAIEYVLGNFLKIDMQGFTQQQILSMNSYEKLLIELGEKSYIPSGSKWPVEIRLLGLIIVNTAFFLIGKTIMAKTGANLMNMINNMNISNNPPIKKTKMKGPSINVDDIN